MAAAALVSLATAPARAEDPPVARHSAANRSAQHWAIELRLGPYYPEIDSEFDGKKTPHERYFGRERRLMTQVELDWELFRGFGTAALGVAAGYYREKAHAFVEAGPGRDADERSSDPTQLSLIPLSLLGIYRFDEAARRWNVPIIPYAKVGLGYTIWTVTNGNDAVASAGAAQGRGRGGTLGWQAAVGVSILLDILDPGAARALDGETGINHTHLFFEYVRFDGAGLGQKNALKVGDTTWVLGLMFEF